MATFSIDVSPLGNHLINRRAVRPPVSVSARTNQFFSATPAKTYTLQIRLYPMSGDDFRIVWKTVPLRSHLCVPRHTHGADRDGVFNAPTAAPRQREVLDCYSNCHNGIIPESGDRLSDGPSLNDQRSSSPSSLPPKPASSSSILPNLASTSSSSIPPSPNSASERTNWTADSPALTRRP